MTLRQRVQFSKIVCVFILLLRGGGALGAVLAAAPEIFSLFFSMQTLSCGMWDLVPRPGIKPRPPALIARSPSPLEQQESPFFFSFLHISHMIFLFLKLKCCV